MEPVSALGVAAAAVQFAEITVKITKRIAVFAALHNVPEDAEGPKAFVERLRSQLGLFNTTIRKIEQGLISPDDSFKDNELLDLKNYISNLNHHGKKLDVLLNKYLPGDGASAPARLLAALKSIAYDTEIKSAMDSINELLPLLTTFLITSIFANNSLETGPGLTNINFSDIYQVSRYEVQYFIPRPKYQAAIDRIFNNEQTQVPKTAILQGMGGQGKTQLAIRYCGKARGEKKVQCILWVDASTKASTVRGFEEISESLSDSSHTLLDSDARVAFVKRRLTAANLSWLLVFDNYDNPTAFDLREYIPKGPLGNVLITSRSEGLDRLGQVIRISGMTQGEAIQLLLTLLNTPENMANRIAAAKIVRRLGYLPLAIDQAGAYMKNEGIALADFLSYYEQSAKDVLESVPNLWEYYESTTSESEQGATSVTAKTVFTTWNLSFTLLKPETPEGALNVAVLSLLAFFNEQMISEEFFEVYYSTNKLSQQPGWISLFIDQEGLWSSRKFDGVMRRFLRLSLITSLNTNRANTKYAFISLHPLVRDWINLRQEKSIYRANFATFTRILGSDLLATLWEDSVWAYGYQMSRARAGWLAGHMARWMDVFKLYKSNLRPTVICTEHGQNMKNIAAEQLIAKFFSDTYQVDNGYEISQWLWESCDISDMHMMRIKFYAGNHQVSCLSGTDKSRAKSRENLQYWRSVLGDGRSGDLILRESRLVVIMSLVDSVHVEDQKECIELCKAELEKLPNNEENRSLRHSILAELAYVANKCKQENICKGAIETILGETEKGGGNDYRKEIWTSWVWHTVLSIVTDNTFDDLSLADRLSLDMLEWAEAEAEGTITRRISISQFRLSRAKVLRNMGKLDEAEAMIRHYIMDGEVGNVQVHTLLGDILKQQGKFVEAYEAFVRALFCIPGTIHLIDPTDLLFKCGNVASKLNLALAYVHFNLMLTFTKEKKDWGWVVIGISELYKVKVTIGTQAARRDALELLLEGLTVFGIKFIYQKGDTQRIPLREIRNTVHLGKSEGSQNSAQDEMVRKALVIEIARSYHVGINYLFWLAEELLEATDVKAAEHAFRLARNLFDKATVLKEHEIAMSTESIFRYAKQRYAVDRDQQKVRDILDWAQTDIRKRIEHVVETRGDWWESWTTSLLDLIETPAQRAKRKYSKAKKKMSRRFSSRMR
ncbi:hypothetical protein ABKA04_008802 [Annulohypoxylon sp. FPYF3050]